MVLHFAKATRIFAQTLPFVLLRVGVGVLFGLLAVVYFGSIIWILTSFLGSLSGIIAIGGLLIAGLVFLAVVKLLRKYVLYLVAAGHIAVIAHIVDTGEVPDSQLAFGKKKVTDRFAEASALFLVDKLITAVVKQFNKRAVSFAKWVSFIPAMETVVKILKQAVGLAASFIDEAILAHLFLHEEKGNWQGAKDGVVLYGKTWKSVLGSTIIIVVGMQLATLALFVVLTPFASVLAGLSPVFELAGWAVIAGFVAVIYFGIAQPWVKTVVITTYLVESSDQTPDSETADYIAERSSKFNDLVAKADDEAAGAPSVPAGGVDADAETATGSQAR